MKLNQIQDTESVHEEDNPNEQIKVMPERSSEEDLSDDGGFYSYLIKN